MLFAVNLEMADPAGMELTCGDKLRPTTLSLCFSSFSIPKVINKDGQVIVHQVTKVALGVRRQPVLLPRPLHDPMAEHAIVLFDPTVDLIETSEEQAARLAFEANQAEAAEEKKKLEANNPHKSLRAILGLKTKDELERAKKEIPKVPVVIDPKLSKVLRPHQVEGVKVRVSETLPSRCGLRADRRLGPPSSCTGARPACLPRTPGVVLSQTRWVSVRPLKPL